jgi:hypothetical protein
MIFSNSLNNRVLYGDIILWSNKHIGLFIFNKPLLYFINYFAESRSQEITRAKTRIKEPKFAL